MHAPALHPLTAAGRDASQKRPGRQADSGVSPVVTTDCYTSNQTLFRVRISGYNLAIKKTARWAVDRSSKDEAECTRAAFIVRGRQLAIQELRI